MTRDEAISYIHSVSWRGSRPGLERIRELCRALGDPQKSLRFIHVAGTNGKGSVCAQLASVLTAAGYKTGLFTSPFVSFFEERIEIDGEPIPGDALGRVTERVRSAAEKMSDPPTEFELLTAVGFEYFKEAECDAVVLETGLGGRLDSTNVIDPPALAVVTGIGLDHTALLGDTEEKIAAEKAGIIKAGSAVVVGPLSDEAFAPIASRARELSCPLVRSDRDRIASPRLTPFGASFSAQPYGELKMNLAGVHQLDNVSVVLTAAEVLNGRGFRIKNEDIKKGLAAARWSARFEPLLDDPLTVYDGAHNPDGIRALTENVKVLLGGRAILVFGVMADKDFGEMIKTVAPVADRVFTVKPDNPRSLDPEKAAALFREVGVPAEKCETVAEGVRRAGAAAKETKLPVLIMGTLYMYAEAADAVLRERETI